MQNVYMYKDVQMARKELKNNWTLCTQEEIKRPTFMFVGILAIYYIPRKRPHHNTLNEKNDNGLLLAFV